jgi:hypothetical protein
MNSNVVVELQIKQWQGMGNTGDNTQVYLKNGVLKIACQRFYTLTLM